MRRASGLTPSSQGNRKGAGNERLARVVDDYHAYFVRNSNGRTTYLFIDMGREMSVNELDDDQPDVEDVIERLRASLADMMEANKGMAAEHDASRAQNAELVAALEEFVAAAEWNRSQLNRACLKARIALHAARQPQGSGE
jgi:DhnA family fructose-bisphosphate aldolase class Ia